MRSRGIYLILDGYDRVPTVMQSRLLADLSVLRRDYPQTAYMILGRIAPAGSHPAQRFRLEGLNLDEQRLLSEQLFPRYSFATQLPSGLLGTLNENPLLLTLILKTRSLTGAWPRDLSSLFEAWIRELLAPDGQRPSERIRLRALLGRIAVVTRDKGRSPSVVLAETAEEDPEHHLLDRLAELGAIITEPQVEIVHDALAEFLQVEAVLRKPKADILQFVEETPFIQGGFLAPLIIASTRDADVQNAMWKRSISLGLPFYFDILRYCYLPSLDSDDRVPRRGVTGD